MTDYVKAYQDPSHIYHNEAMRIVSKLNNDAYFMDGVIRWNTSAIQKIPRRM